MTFTPEKRFPYATKIQAVIPKGTKSFDSYELPDDFRWSFRTIQPKLLRHFPENKQQWLDLETEVLLIFNIPLQRNKAKDYIALTAVDSTDRESALDFDIKSPSKDMLEENDIKSSPDKVLWLKPKQKLKPERGIVMKAKMR